MAIVLLSYQQYVNFNAELPTDFNLLIENWQLSPINNLTFPSDSTNLTLNITIDNHKFTNFTLNDQIIMIQPQKIEEFSFIKNYTLKPSCEPGYKLCGGVELNSKYCVLNTIKCPINDLLTNLSIESNFYEVRNDSHSKKIMLLSTFQSKQPIIDFRFGYNNKVCQNTSQFLDCDKELLYYNQIASCNASQFCTDNQISSSFCSENGTVGLFVGRIIEFDLNCRYTLIQRIIESPTYYSHLADILYIQTIATLVYCIFIGIFLNLVHFFMLSNFSFLLIVPSSDPNHTQIIKRIIYFVRIISFIPFGTIICLLYFYEAQFYDTINRVIKNNCIEQKFIIIFQDTLDQLTQFRSIQTAIFWIFITALIIEILATFVVVYRSVNIKKTNLVKQQYENELEMKLEILLQQSKQNQRPPIHASFSPNEQQAIRQTIVGERRSQRNANQLNEISEQSGEYEFNRNSVKPVWEPDQQPIPLQSPVNYQFYNKTK